jgi:DNA-directed RNA polymerase subunit omega
MAKVTSEKAVQQIGNRFNLVLAAAQRARELKNGSMQRVSGKDHSTTVTALREIEEGKYTWNDYLSKIKSKKRRDIDEYHIT